MELTTILETASMTLLLGSISLLAGWKLLKQRIYTAFAQMASQLVGEFMLDAIEHPEKLKPVLDAVIQQGFKSAGIESTGKMGRVKIGGLSIPGEVAQMAMPLIQQLFKGFAGDATKKAAETVFG